MKIAVTGSTGHIGANLIRGLLQEGHQVLAIYRTERKLKALEGLDIETAKGDILNKEFLVQAFRGSDVVIHLAGKISINGDPDGDLFNINVEGTKNVVEACLETGVKKLVHFSSIEAFKIKINTKEVNEHTPRADKGCFKYGYSKALGEQEALKGLDRGLDVIILNPTGVIGPHDYWLSLSGQLIADLMNNKLHALVKGGFDWVDVDDVVKGTILALEKGKSGEKYILSGHWKEASYVAKLCSKVSGSRPPKLNLPIDPVFIAIPFVKLASWITGKQPIFTYESLMILKHSNKRFSHEKAKKELGYSVRPLEETIHTIYEWNRQIGRV